MKIITSVQFSLAELRIIRDAMPFIYLGRELKWPEERYFEKPRTEPQTQEKQHDYFRWAGRLRDGTIWSRGQIQESYTAWFMLLSVANQRKEFANQAFAHWKDIPKGQRSTGLIVDMKDMSLVMQETASQAIETITNLLAVLMIALESTTHDVEEDYNEDEEHDHPQTAVGLSIVVLSGGRPEAYSFDEVVKNVKAQAVTKSTMKEM